MQCRTETDREHLCRYSCQVCGHWFNDLSQTKLEASKVSLSRWFYLMRELDKGRPVTQQRGSPRMVIEMVKEAPKRSLLHLATKHITPGSRIDTDSWRGYHWLKPVYDHRSVKHSECYVKDGVHCNTAEAEWSLFKPWWVTFRGVAKRHIYL